MTNRRAVFAALDRFAFAHELLDNPQARAFGRAAWSVRNFDGDLPGALASGALRKLPGVGAATIRVLEAVLGGDEPPGLAELEGELPPGLFEVRRVKGLGPKKVRALWRDLGVTTLGELEYACNENRLVDLKGFGAKTQDKVLAEIARLRANEGRFRLDQAHAAAMPALEALWAAGEALLVGDARRGCEIVTEVELAAQTDAENARRALEAAGFEPDEALALQAGDGLPVQIHCCPDPARFGWDTVRLTGAPAHLDALRARAAQMGHTLDEHALLDGTAPVPTPDEDALYHALGVHTVPPERREADTALVPWSAPQPRLVRRRDLEGALHAHTTASDGAHSLEEMRRAASALGLGYLGITEHSQTAAYAGGLDAAALTEQARRIAALNAEGDRCVLLAGIESDILPDGGLDYPAEVLDGLDFVIASVHRRHGQDVDAATARMCAAATDPYTDIVGHPTGRLLLGRAPNAFDMEAFLDACAAAGCAVELNASPHRLDLDARTLAMARERGIPVSIGPDAHSVEALQNLEYGITIARRAGLRPQDVLNTRPVEALREWVLARRGGLMAGV